MEALRREPAFGHGSCEIHAQDDGRFKVCFHGPSANVSTRIGWILIDDYDDLVSAEQACAAARAELPPDEQFRIGVRVDGPDGPFLLLQIVCEVHFPSDDPAWNLERLSRHRDSGALTEAEFQAFSAPLLKRIEQSR